MCAAIEKMNPSVICFENTKAFINSKTLDLIKRQLTGYRFEQVILDSHDFGEIESRRRACVIAVSEGLPSLGLVDLKPPVVHSRPILSDYMEAVPEDSPLWREFAHLIRKDKDTRTNYRNTLYSGCASKIGTLIASSASAKAGSPMIRHPTNPNLQRQVTELEHARIRDLPKGVFDQVMAVANGTHQLVSKRGSKTAVHRLCGNGVSKKVWQKVGQFLGRYLTNDVSGVKPQLDLVMSA